MTAVLEAMRLGSGSKLRDADEIVWMISCAETSQDRRRLEGVVLCRCCVVLWTERDGDGMLIQVKAKWSVRNLVR
jgi:hypothetical protein